MDSLLVTIRGFGFRPKPIHVRSYNDLNDAYRKIFYFANQVNYSDADCYNSPLIHKLAHYTIYNNRGLFDLDYIRRNHYKKYDVRSLPPRRWKVKTINAFNKPPKNSNSKRSKGWKRMIRQRRNHRKLSQNYMNGRKTNIKITAVKDYTGPFYTVEEIAFMIFLCKISQVYSIEEIYYNEHYKSMANESIKEIESNIRLWYTFQFWGYLQFGDSWFRTPNVNYDAEYSPEYVLKYFREYPEHQNVFHYVKYIKR